MTVQQLMGLDQSVIGESTFEPAFGGMLEGVCLGYANEGEVRAFVLLALRVQTGIVATGGVFVEVPAAQPVALAAADPALSRYDRIVVRRDNNTNAVWIGVKTGTPAANPVPPALTRTGGTYEISLAQVYVKAGDAAITDNEIIDERGDPAVCGYMNFKAAEIGDRDHVAGFRQNGHWSVYANAAAVEGSGLYEGLITTHNASTLVQDADGIGLQQDTDGTLNDDAFVYGVTLVHRTSYHTVFECKFKLAQTTDERLCVGLFQLPIAGLVLGLDDPNQDHAALQFSTARADANFMFSVGDATFQNLIDSGIPVDTDAHIIRIITYPSYICLELMDTDRNIEAAVRVTANIPVENTDLVAWSGIRALAVAVKSLFQYYGEGVHRNI